MVGLRHYFHQSIGLALCALLLAAVDLPVARSDESDTKQDARTLMQSGLKLFNASDYLGALAMFRSAYQQYPSTKILLNIATTLRQLDRKAEAANTYQRYLVAKDSDPAKQPEVSKVLAQLDAELAVLTFACDNSCSDEEVTITVGDSEPFVLSSVSKWRVNAGEFRVRAVQGKRAPFESRGDAVVGKTAAVAIAFVVEEQQPVVVAEARQPSRWGATLRVLADYKYRGGAVQVGGSVNLGTYVVIHAGGVIGPVFGGYVGAQVNLLQRALRPYVAVGAPVFFSDGVRVGTRAALGGEWLLGKRFSVFVEGGAQYMLNSQMGIDKLLVVPALGVAGRI